MKKKTRVQFELPNDSMARLARLKDITESSSYADVTKNSYKLYEKMIGFMEEGYTLVLEKDGKQKEFEIFY